MRNKNRTYNSIKLFRGKRKNNELESLAEAKQDFEYRRLFIEERELDLHVFFSRKTVAEMISWGFVFLSFCYFRHPSLALTMFGLSVTAKFYSIYCQKQLNKIYLIYVNILKLVDSVITKDYGISL